MQRLWILIEEAVAWLFSSPQPGPEDPAVQDRAQYLRTLIRWMEGREPPARYLSLREWTDAQRVCAALRASKPRTRAVRRVVRKARRLLARGDRRALNRAYLRRRDGDPALARLNPHQRRAALIDDDRALIIAGAGSGKTRTLVAKAKDLIRSGQVRPEEVAIVTFTKKAADEIREALKGHHGVEVGTIHHLARETLRILTGEEVVVTPLVTGSRRLTFFQRWLERTVHSDPAAAISVILRREALRQDARPAGVPRIDRYMAPPDNVIVKSASECIVACTLWLAGLPYGYEESFAVPKGHGDGRRYRPDFFIPDAPRPAGGVPDVHSGVWMEHYAFDSEGRLPMEWERERPGSHREYVQSHRWKTELHRKLRTRYVETSFGERKRIERENGNYPAELLRRLQPLVPHQVTYPTEGQVRKALEKHLGGQRLFQQVAFEIEKWVETTRQVVDPDALIEEAMRRAADHPDSAQALKRLAQAAQRHYEEELERTGALDYEGMILRAWEAAAADGERLPWKRILVDEWQDVNPAQSAFLHTLARKREANLTVVGDDWQAIYGFQGGDVDLLRKFEDPAGETTAPAERTTLEISYRFGQKLADSAKAFAIAQGRDTGKAVVGAGEASTHPLHSARIQMGTLQPREKNERHSAPERRTEALKLVLKKCREYPNARSVLILGRKNMDLWNATGGENVQVGRLLRRWERKGLPEHLKAMGPAEIERQARNLVARGNGFRHGEVMKQAQALGLEVNILTVHKAKGLEADLVVFIDSEPPRGKPGDGSGLHAPFQKYLRPNHDEAAEERRIWYVALTRCRQAVFVLVPGGGHGHSVFADELWHNKGGRYDVGCDALADLLDPMTPMVSCPACQAAGRTTMVLTARSGAYGLFTGCSSYEWGAGIRCGHTEERCQKCGEGIMARSSESPGRSQCLNWNCQHQVPLCGCTPPKPMWWRTDPKDGSSFLGCQGNRGRSGRGCRKVVRKRHWKEAAKFDRKRRRVGAESVAGK